MKHMKRLSAVLLVAVMLISMLSCMVFGTTAAQLELGGPVSIEKMPLRGEATENGGIVVGGQLLTEPDVLVVNSDWESAKGLQPIKLGGIVYNVTIGVNGFAEVASALEAADGHETIYVAAGLYEAGIVQTVGNIKLYGPKAGINPNDPKDLSKPNAKRPAAAGLEASKEGEAVLTGGMTYSASGSDLVLDGFYLGGGFSFVTDGSMSTGATNYRFGTVVRNCVVNTTAGNLFNHSVGNSPNMEISNLRVLAGKNLVNISGMMDIRVFNNYLNLTGNTIDTKLVCAGSMGSYALIENNYYEYCGGNVFRYDHEQQTALYAAIVRNNYIADMGPAAFVHNTYFGAHTLPGTNLQITNNTVMGIDKGQTVFDFPFVGSYDYYYEFQFMVNINENYFDLPENTFFVKSAMNGSLNLINNYYATPISVDRITKHEDAKLDLYPYYADEAMTKSVGSFSTAMDKVEIDHVNKRITINLVKMGLTANPIDLNPMLKTDDECSWKLYEDKTLETEVENKKAYLSGVVTQYFAEITTLDGKGGVVYEIRLLSGDTTEAALVDVVIDSNRAPMPVIQGKTFTYNFPADLAFVDYELKVSPGAKYEVYAKYDYVSNNHTPFEDIGNYIPHGGYQFDVVISSGDGMKKEVYTVVFNRERDAASDPSLIGGKAPSTGTYRLLRDGSLLFESEQLLTKATFELVATPGASYTIFSDAAKKKAVSSSEQLKEIALKEGETTFYVEVCEGEYKNTIPFIVRNEGKSNDAEIVGMSGLTPIINNNVINVQSGGTTLSATFNTSDPYAVVKVYADPARKIALDYVSTPIEAEPNRFIDQRSFTLDITHAVSKYFVDCIAENGKVNRYDLIVTKNVNSNAYNDVPEDAWYKKYVEAAGAEGVLQGSPSGEGFAFRGDDNTTRQEMAIVASRLLGYNTTAFADVKLPFADTAKIADWALGNVKVAYYFGVMKGSADATGLNFRPESNISREEAFAMFVRIYDLSGSADLTAFKDHASVSPWAKKSIEAAVASGLIEGDDNGMLNPQKPITRAELAAMISRV
ncbi:MAG: S-layer homology domain-containing protein [Clostridia bacterium]|nr:S-layer homology domain-containing protein [Clostridia bacterium]